MYKHCHNRYIHVLWLPGIWAAELDQRTQRNHLLINILSVQKTETRRNCHFCLNVRNLHIFICVFVFMYRYLCICSFKTILNLNEPFKFLKYLIYWSVPATVNVDQRNEKGWTALMFAARHGQTGVIETLLEKG